MQQSTLRPEQFPEKAEITVIRGSSPEEDSRFHGMFGFSLPYNNIDVVAVADKLEAL